MKKTLKWISLLWMVVSLSSCQLAIPSQQTKEETTDRLVGFFITTSTINEEMDNNGRIYGNLIMDGSMIDTYTFKDIEGMTFFTSSIGSGEERTRFLVVSPPFYDVHNHFGVSDGSESLLIEGNLDYFGEEVVFQMNPAFQDADDRIYATVGESYLVGGLLGSELSAQLDQTVEEETDLGTKSISTEIKVNLKNQRKPLQVSIVEMDKNHQLIDQYEVQVQTMEETLVLHQNTEYLLVEILEEDDQEHIIFRQLYSVQEDRMELPFPDKDGFVYRKLIVLKQD